MKYELIKTYPHSPKLGTIIYRKSSGEDYWTYDEMTVALHRKDTPENYPEFWEKIVEKTYEILSFINNSILITKKKNRLFSIVEVEEGVQPAEYYNKYDYIKINSIKRLSDSVVFTLGDTIKRNGYNETHKIRGFYVHKDGYIYVSISDAVDEAYVSMKVPNISSIEHVKPVLFVTEDGVDIFEGDKELKIVYTVNKAFNLNKNIIGITVFNNCKIFSTKEKAEEYILMNKPSLSINDLKNTIYLLPEALEKQLKELVKNR